MHWNTLTMLLYWQSHGVCRMLDVMLRTPTYIDYFVILWYVHYDKWMLLISILLKSSRFECHGLRVLSLQRKNSSCSPIPKNSCLPKSGLSVLKNNLKRPEKSTNNIDVGKMLESGCPLVATAEIYQKQTLILQTMQRGVLLSWPHLEWKVQFPN